MYLKLLPAVQAHDGPEIHHMLEIQRYFAKRLWLKSPDDKFKLTAFPDECWCPFDPIPEGVQATQESSLAYIPRGL